MLFTTRGRIARTSKADHNLILPAAQTLLPGAKTIQCIDATGIEKSMAAPTSEMMVPGYLLALLLN